MTEPASAMLPMTDFVKLPSDGPPYLEGHRCAACGTIYMAPRRACGKCMARGDFALVRLSDKGRLYSYTIVYRSFPGVKTPFISAVVDLDDGAVLKGTLINVEPDPACIKMDMALDVVFDEAGREDSDGNRYISYFFQPAKD